MTISDPVAPFTPESMRASLVSIIADAHRVSVGTSTRNLYSGDLSITLIAAS